jgi:hypothetical protein
MRVQGPGTNEFKQSYWFERFKLVPRPLDKGPRPKSGKLRLNLHATCWRENQLVQTQKTVLKGELLIWRTKNQARDQGTVQFKDSICVKLDPRKLDPGHSSKVGLKEAWPAQIVRKMPYSRNLKI